MRTEEQKKEILQKVIDYVRRGYRITGKDSATTNAGINYTDLYIMLNEFPALKAGYEAAKAIRKINRQPTDKRLGTEQKRELIKRIIAYVADGYTIRGRHSAIERAANDMQINKVHWQTVHVWLRKEFADLKQDYLNAKYARQQYNQRKAASEKK
jgi:phenylpyruvate tautomerase PptA (4-oxalocrotonate tautomerase family)